MASALAALLFDVDGTLAETERDGHRVAFNQAFAERRLSWYWDEALYGRLLQVTGGRERIEHYARYHDPHWLERADARSDIAAIHASKNRHYAARVRAGRIALRPGLRELLVQAHCAGLQLGLVTTTSRDNVDALLQAADLGETFAMRITGEDVVRKKPDGECYALALQRLDCPPQRALAIEDSRNGLRAASAAGVRTLIVRSHYFRDEKFDGAFEVIAGFPQLSIDDLRRRFCRQTVAHDGLSRSCSAATVAVPHGGDTT